MSKTVTIGKFVDGEIKSLTNIKNNENNALANSCKDIKDKESIQFKDDSVLKINEIGLQKNKK